VLGDKSDPRVSLGDFRPLALSAAVSYTSLVYVSYPPLFVEGAPLKRVAIGSRRAPGYRAMLCPCGFLVIFKYEG